MRAHMTVRGATAARAAQISLCVEVLELVEVDEEVLLAVTLDVALELPVAVRVADEDFVPLGLPDEEGEIVDVAVDVEDDVEVGEEVELACSAKWQGAKWNVSAVGETGERTGGPGARCEAPKRTVPVCDAVVVAEAVEDEVDVLVPLGDFVAL